MMETQAEPNLCLDVGNTATKAAVFRAGRLVGSVVRFTDQEWAVADRLVTNHGVKNIIYSTVANVPPAQWTDKWTAAGLRVVPLSSCTRLPFVSRYTTMDTLGQDRIAVVAAGVGRVTPTAPASAPNLPPGVPPKLIVDAGTCITLDLVDATGTYLGGNISPGLRMRLRAMHEFTARLPLPRSTVVQGAVGISTEGALLHGGRLGAVYEIEGLYRRLSGEHADLRLWLTGGDAAWLADHLSVPFFHYPNLVLEGLHQILTYHVAHLS